MTDQEINEAVARKLGWKKEKGFWWSPIISEVPKLTTNNPLPDFCHSLEAAWEIVEWCKFHKRQIHLDTTNVSWVCLIGHSQHGIVVHSGEADTAPLAICLAFLKLPPS